MTFRWCLAIVRDFQRYTHDERDDDVNAIVIVRERLLDEKRPRRNRSSSNFFGALRATHMFGIDDW